MFRFKTDFFRYLITFSLLGLAQAMQGMEGLGAPGSVEVTGATVANVRAQLGIDVADALLAQQLMNEDLDRLYPEDQGLPEENRRSGVEALTRKRKRATCTVSSLDSPPRAKRVSVKHTDAPHPLLQALENASFEPSAELVEDILKMLDDRGIPSQVLLKAFTMAISRDLTDIALKIFNPGNLQSSRLSLQQLCIELLRIANNMDGELLQKLAHFRDPITEEGIHPNILLTLFERALKNGQSAVVELLVSCCTLSQLGHVYDKIDIEVHKELAKLIADRMEKILLDSSIPVDSSFLN